MPDNLRNRTINALSWSFAGKITRQFIQFATSIILARLLVPEHFGLIGMLTIFIALAESIMDSGFSSALMQKKQISHVEKCSVFFFNFCIGALAYTVIFFAAPWIAQFYGEPVLIPLVRFLALKFVIGPVGMVQRTLLGKKLLYKALSTVTASSSLIGGAIGITLAYLGYGVWAIGVSQVAGGFFQNTLPWYFSNWRPSAVFSFKALRNLFSFGSRLLMAGLLDKFFTNIYKVVIGRLFPAAALGLYSKAYNLEQIPTKTLTTTVSRVMFPVFSKLQDQPERLKNAASKAIKTLVMVASPMMLGMAVVARPMVHVLLGEHWLEVVPYLQIFCVVGMMHPFLVINLHVVKSLGYSELVLRRQFFKNALILLNLVISYRWGVIGLVGGQAIVSVLDAFLLAGYTSKVSRYSVRRQLADCLPYIGVSLVMGGAVFSLTGIFTFPNDIILLITQVFSGIFIYWAICRLFRLAAFMELLDLLRLISRQLRLKAANI